MHTSLNSGDLSFRGRGSPPLPPRYDQWPETVQHAMRLRGCLIRCGPGVRGVGWPETATVRLAALAPWLDDPRLIASHMTAAWVWGAARHAPSELRISTVAGQHSLARSYRSGARKSTNRRSELRLSPEDRVKLGMFCVTSPLRTVIDLLHDPDHFGLTERVAYRLLLPLIPGAKETVFLYLSTHRRPHARLARERALESAENHNDR